MIIAQGGQPVPTTPLELITASDTVTQVVLGFLALLSAISWTIIFSKWMELRSARRAGVWLGSGAAYSARGSRWHDALDTRAAVCGRGARSAL